MYLIIVYDISDVKKQAKIRNFLRRFLIHVQLSVFEGEVAPSQLTEIELFLKEQDFEDKDGIIVYVLRDQTKVKKIYFGEQKEVDERAFFI